jgi:hydrogenase maturation protease
MLKTGVLAIGDLSRGDDAAAVFALRRLSQLVRPHSRKITFQESSGDLHELLRAFRSFESIYILEVLWSKSPLNKNIEEFDAILNPLPQAELRASPHALALAQAIEVARALGILPRQIRIFALQGQRFAPHSEPSPKVCQLLEAMARVIHKELEQDFITDHPQAIRAA